MKKRNPIFGIVCLLAMTTALLSGCGCSDSTATPDEAVETSIQTVTEIATDEQGNTYIEEATEIVEIKTDGKSDEKSENEKSENSKADDTDDKKDSSSSKSSSSSSSKSGNNSRSSKNSNSSSNKNSSSSKSSSSSSSTSNNQKSSNTEETKHTHSWVDITKQVKIVDQEAYTYEEPVYETQDRTICNVCHIDITDNRVEHSRNHALNDEGGGYHNELTQVQVGTKTVEVPEKSHYTTEIIGRKCSSCDKTEYY